MPLLGPDHVVPKHQQNKTAGTGLSYDSTHFTSARNYNELDKLSLPPDRQSDVYGHVFGAGAKGNDDARKRVRQGHAELISKLGGGPEARQLHKARHEHMDQAAMKGNAIHGNLETISNRGFYIKNGVTSVLQAWALNGAMPEIGVDLTVRVGREAGNEMSKGWVIPEFGQWNPVVAFVGGLAFKHGLHRVHDYIQPSYGTGITAKRNDMGRQADTFRVNAEQASMSRAGSAGAGIVRAYGEEGRDHMEDAMNTTDRSIYDYMKAMPRQTRWAMEPDQHMTATGVVSAAIQADLARLAEADFFIRFAERDKNTWPNAYYWQPPELPQTGYLSAVTDPTTGHSRPPGARARKDVSEADRPQRWDYRPEPGPVLADVAKALKDVPWGDYMLAQMKLALAKLGKGAGLVQLGEMCEDGRLGMAQGPTSRRMAERLYEIPARQGDKQAQYRLGRMLAEEAASGPAGSPGDLLAADWLHKAAWQGSPEACAELGLMHAAKRLGENSSDSQACEWLRKAVVLGSSEVLFTLGSVHERNRGDAGQVEQANRDAAKWYHEATKLGHVEAYLRLGLLHYRRAPGLTGEISNDADAAKYLGIAKEKGNADAAYYLTLMYRDLRALPEGDTLREEAMLACLDQAVVDQATGKGHVKAQALRGQMLVRGELKPAKREGAPADQEAARWQEAAHWLLMAARGGDVESQCELADLYRDKKVEPEGPQSSSAAAEYWYKEAETLGSERARKVLHKRRAATLAAQMSRQSKEKEKRPSATTV